MPFATVFVITLIVLCAIGALILVAAYFVGIGPVREKHAREAAKLAVDLLRARRLEQDLAVVENRAHLVASQEALVGLKIEKARRDLSMPADRSTPTTPGTDSPAW